MSDVHRSPAYVDINLRRRILFETLRIARWDIIQHLRSSSLALLVVFPSVIAFALGFSEPTSTSHVSVFPSSLHSVSAESHLSPSTVFLVLIVSVIGSLHLRSMRTERQSTLYEIFVAHGSVRQLIIGKWISACVLTLLCASSCVIGLAEARTMRGDVLITSDCIAVVLFVTLNASIYLAAFSALEVQDLSELFQSLAVLMIAGCAGWIVSHARTSVVSSSINWFAFVAVDSENVWTEKNATFGCSEGMRIMKGLFGIALANIILLSLAVWQAQRSFRKQEP